MVRPETVVVVAVVDVQLAQDPDADETHHWYEVAPVLACQLKDTVVERFLWLFLGEILLNEPGSDAACVVNAHHAPASAVVSPPAFEARTCQKYVVPAERPVTDAEVAVPAPTQDVEQAESFVVSTQYA